MESREQPVRRRPLPLALAAIMLRSALTLLVAGFLATVLVQFAPGFGVDEHALDVRFGSAPSVEPDVRQSASAGPLISYAGYLRRLGRGDFGVSQAFAMPVNTLLRDRIGPTLRNVSIGLVLAWFVSLLLCAVAATVPRIPARLSGALTASLFLCVPAGLVAFGAAALRLSAGFGIAAVVFPRVYRFMDNLLIAGRVRTPVLAARARGLSEGRILFNYILRDSAPHLLALAGVTANIAFGAAIPMEVLCDVPGIGQLAWRAALARDIDLVIAVTLILTLVTLFANRLAALLGQRFAGRPL